MAGYELLLEGYEFTREDDGSEEGVKIFVARGGAERDLPALESTFGDVEGTYGGSAPSTNCKLRKIACRVLGNDTKKYTCEYSTSSGATDDTSSSSGINNLRAPADTVESVRASVETFQVMGDEDSNSVEWASGGTVKGYTTAAIQMFCVQYTKELNYDTLADAIIASLTGALNKIDASNGNWLYEGFDAQQMKNDSDDTVFRVTRSYKFRSQSWNKFYRNDEGGVGWQDLVEADRPFETTETFPDTMPF